MHRPWRLVCGRHAVEAALEAGTARILRAVPGSNRDLVGRAKSIGVEVEAWTDGKLAAMVAGAKHQGVVALCEAILAQGWRNAIGPAANPLLVVLDQVQDPHNLGACLRTAAALGAHALVVPQRRSASLTPAARKVAAGAEEQVTVDVVVNVARELAAMRDLGLLVVGADAGATDDLFQLGHAGPLALVMGGEAKGMRALTRRQCDTLVRIPMPGAKDIASLNVAVACGVCLSAVNLARAQAPA